MEPFIKTTNTKRFVVEDSVTKVTSDGEPHGIMTMVAVLSGILAAVVILSILASLVGCKKSRRVQNCRGCSVSIRSDSSVEKQAEGLAPESKRSSISTIYNSSMSIIASTDMLPACVPQPIISSMYKSSELNLCDSLQHKKKLHLHWQDEVKDSQSVAETRIDVKRY